MRMILPSHRVGSPTVARVPTAHYPPSKQWRSRSTIPLSMASDHHEFWSKIAPERYRAWRGASSECVSYVKVTAHGGLAHGNRTPGIPRRHRRRDGRDGDGRMRLDDQSPAVSQVRVRRLLHLAATPGGAARVSASTGSTPPAAPGRNSSW